ncbi:MAG: histidine kinase N-terminal 7TM domain-containing protein [Candidatus Hodarchaeales archaeon]|jgi:signal transduction histidine kinase
MSYAFNAFAIPYLIALLLAGFISVYAFVMFEKTRTTILFVALTTSLSIWIFGSFFEMLSTELSLMIFWELFRYLGVNLAVVFFLLFTLSLTSFAPKLFSKPQYLVSLFVPGAIDYLLIITNESHHLVFTELSLHPTAPFPALYTAYGILYTMHFLIGAFFVIGGILTLLLVYRRTSHVVYRRQLQLFLVGVGFFVIITIISTLRIFPFSDYLDIVPLAYVVTCLFLLVGMREYHLIDLIPVAHQIIISNLSKTGIIATDKDNRIIEINPRAREYLFQEENLELIGKNLFSMVLTQKHLPPLFFDKFLEVKESLFAMREDPNLTKSFEFELLQPLKPEIEYLNVSVEALRVNRNLTGYVYILRDISTEKVIEATTKKSSDFKDSLLGVISHDLRNQLFVISGFTEVIRGELSQGKKMNPEELLEFLDGIDAKVEGASTIIMDVRNFLKIMGTFDKPLEPSIIDLKEILESVVLSFKPSLASNQLQLLIKWPESHNQILTLADLRIRSVFNNVIDNAIKWSPSKGAIEIIVDKKDQFWIFSIIDEGPGVPDTLKEIVFKPFTSFGSEEKSGSGLGLSITAEILTTFKGKIWLEDNTPTGTIFKLTLPIVTKKKEKLE